MPIEPLLDGPFEAGERRRWQKLVASAALGFQRSLGTSGPPLALVDVDGVPSLWAGGIAGTFRMGGVEWTVIPKFVAEEARATWERSVLSMVGRARQRAFKAERRGELGTTNLCLLDVFALAFTEAVERALEGAQVLSYRVEECECGSLRGKLMIDRQLQHLTTRPHVFSCAIDGLDADNPVNHLLGWAACRFGALALPLTLN